jgi:hypothetical protein
MREQEEIDKRIIKSKKDLFIKKERAKSPLSLF